MGGEARFAWRQVVGVVGRDVRELASVYQGVELTELIDVAGVGEQVCTTPIVGTFTVSQSGPAPELKAWVPKKDRNGPAGHTVKWTWDLGSKRFKETARVPTKAKGSPNPDCRTPE
ncbi:MAG: hypothetical protein ACI9MR_004826 [Myxococcota bacterium]|jgi:hypothetical protein